MIREKSLAGCHVMVVDDDYDVATALVSLLRAHGADIVGPAGNVADALALVAESGRIDSAILDVNLRGETVYPVAEALRKRKVRMVFITGYDRHFIDPAFDDVPCLQKPYAARQLVSAISG